MTTKLDLERLKTMFEAGETTEDIASALNCSPSSVCRHARLMGLSRERPKPYRKFSPEEDAYLRAHEGESIRSIADKTGIPWATVQRRMRSLGLECKIQDNTWSDADVYKLRQMAADGSTVQEIATALDRTETAITLKARKTGIKIYQPGRKWSPEELDTLRREWGKAALSTLASHVHRTPDATAQQAHKMRLPPVYANSEDISLADFCRATGISRDRIIGTLVPKYGFPLLSKKYGKQQYYYFVEFESILPWLEKHQSLFDASRIEQDFLVPEPDWLRAKRKKDLWDKSDISEDAKRRYWTDYEIERAKHLRSMDMSIEDIAEDLGRGAWGVRCKLVSSEGTYLIPRFWSWQDCQFIRDHWKTMSDKEMAEALGKTVDSVEYHRLDMSLSRRPKK